MMEPDLWCLRLKPVKDTKNVEKQLEWIARGPGTGMNALMWTAKVMVGLSDNRNETYETRFQRLAVWTSRKGASRAAKDHNRKNPYWKAIPQQVKIILASK